MARSVSKQKVHTTALALLPPEELWEPIQVIRRKHDRHLSRWPQPHINLVYPFVPGADFVPAAALLGPVLSSVRPFKIKLRRFKYFVHSKRSTTLWLDPETDPPDALDSLQRILTDTFPFADDLRVRFNGAFSGHISVGQFPGEKAVQLAQENFGSKWQSVEFTVDKLVFLSREGRAEDCFRIERTLPLGALSLGRNVTTKVEDEAAKRQERSAGKTSPYLVRSVSGSSTGSANQQVVVELDVETKPSPNRVKGVEPSGVRPARLLTSEELAAREALVVKVLGGVI